MTVCLLCYVILTWLVLAFAIVAAYISEVGSSADAGRLVRL